MFRIIAAKNKFEGELRNFDLGGDDLVVRWVLSGPESVETTFPKVPPSLKASIGRVGLSKLADSTLDLNTGNITINNPMETGGSSVKTGKKLIKDSRPQLKLGGGSLIG